MFKVSNKNCIKLNGKWNWSTHGKAAQSRNIKKRNNCKYNGAAVEEYMYKNF